MTYRNAIVWRDVCSFRRMTSPSVSSSLTWSVWIVTAVILGAPSARSGVATLEAAQAVMTTAANAAMMPGFAATASDEPATDLSDDTVPAIPFPAREALARPSDHMFGVLPNYATVETGGAAPGLTPKQLFEMAALGSFDPYVVPFVGVVAGLSPAPGQSYGRRYTTSLADNSIGNFLTSAVLPLSMGQDPRYFQSGRGSIARRVAYAASRSVITRGRSGSSQFNVSEIGGNAIAAGLSNLYHVPADRTLTGTITRWGMQVMWDTLSNEMKEFWPDIRRKLHRQ